MPDMDSTAAIAPPDHDYTHYPAGQRKEYRLEYELEKYKTVFGSGSFLYAYLVGAFTHAHEHYVGYTEPAHEHGKPPMINPAVLSSE